MPSELGNFLRSRRARVRPDDLGISARGARRVPGLRREEVAFVAGVSADYYTRVEQGRVRPSRQVLDAVGHALRLDEDEREHMLRLSESRPARLRSRAAAEVVGPGAQCVLDHFEDLPVVVLGRRLDALAWTPLAAALLDLGTDGERNMARRVFLGARSLYPRWEAVAAEMVSHLRRLSTQHGDDVALMALVGELAVTSADFARLWSRHDVTTGISDRKQFHHPLAGAFELVPEVLTVARDGLTVCVYRAEQETAGALALDSLRAQKRW